MRATRKLLALALAAGALQPAMAGTVPLNFENITSTTKLTNQYESLGVSFTGGAWGLASRYNGCPGGAAFVRENSCGALQLAINAPTTPSDTDYASFVVNLSGGFIDELTFAYSVRSGADVLVQLWDGANGTGQKLGELGSFPGSTCNIQGPRFCEWFDASIRFAGTALSMTVSGLDQRFMLDDLTFITPPTTGTQLPEPGGVALALGALGALGWTRKRTTR